MKHKKNRKTTEELEIIYNSKNWIFKKKII